MTDRLSDVEGRIASVQQLSAVVTAMRGIAAARSREARDHLQGIRTYSDMIGKAIGTALALLPPEIIPSGSDIDGHALVAFCAGQGFAGTFSEHVLDETLAIIAEEPLRHARLFVLGDRGQLLAAERDLQTDWQASMIAHLGQVPQLADRILEALYERLEDGRITEVTLVYTALSSSGHMEITRRRVIPFDYGRFSPSRSTPPLTTLSPRRLLEQLAQEYVFTEICEALAISFAAENEARTRSMVAAKANVGRTLNGLVSLSRQLRQEEITNEIIELSAGEASG